MWPAEIHALQSAPIYRASKRQRKTEDTGANRLRGDEDLAAASNFDNPNPIPVTRMVAVEPNPYREFRHAWMLDPLDKDLFKRIAECQEGASDGEDSTFLDLHFFPDSCLV